MSKSESDPLPTVTSMDEPGRAELMAWLAVYGNWLAGDPQPMADWVRNPQTVIVEDARHFLADNLLRPIKRKRGLKQLIPDNRKRHITALVYAAREAHEKKHTDPRRKAIAAVSKSELIDESTVRRIIGEMTKAGITFELWKKMGRPAWLSRHP